MHPSVPDYPQVHQDPPSKIYHVLPEKENVSFGNSCRQLLVNFCRQCCQQIVAIMVLVSMVTVVSVLFTLNSVDRDLRLVKNDLQRCNMEIKSLNESQVKRAGFDPFEVTFDVHSLMQRFNSQVFTQFQPVSVRGVRLATRLHITNPDKPIISIQYGSGWVPNVSPGSDSDMTNQMCSFTGHIGVAILNSEGLIYKYKVDSCVVTDATRSVRYQPGLQVWSIRLAELQENAVLKDGKLHVLFDIYLI